MFVFYVLKNKGGISFSVLLWIFKYDEKSLELNKNFQLFIWILWTVKHFSHVPKIDLIVGTVDDNWANFYLPKEVVVLMTLTIECHLPTIDSIGDLSVMIWFHWASSY